MGKVLVIGSTQGFMEHALQELRKGNQQERDRFIINTNFLFWRLMGKSDGAFKAYWRSNERGGYTLMAEGAD